MAALLARVARGIRALGGKRDVGVFRRGDIVWELDLKEGIDFAIYLQGVRARDLAGYRRSCSRSLSVLNIGADIGSHTLPLAQMEGPSFSQPRVFQAGQRAPSYACGPLNPRKARGHPIQLAS